MLAKKYFLFQRALPFSSYCRAEYITSGALYHRVTTYSVRLTCSLKTPRASPKSVIFNLQFEPLIRIFSGFSKKNTNTYQKTFENERGERGSYQISVNHTSRMNILQASKHLIQEVLKVVVGKFMLRLYYFG